MPAIITLITDFGLGDGYVGSMKGVILGVNPDTAIVDISHIVPPQDIKEAAYLLGSVWESFPQHTVHLCVVDPGVGTSRKAVILRTPKADFVAPDNGVLSYILQCTGDTASRRQINVPAGMEAVSITNHQFWCQPVSNVFHGRDIFAPVAAHLSRGIALKEFGDKLDSLTCFALPQPVQEEAGVFAGEIIHIDGFGNVITNFLDKHLPAEGSSLSIEIGKHIIVGLSRHYQDGKGLIGLIGSSGRLEIALKEGNARKYLKATVGQKVMVRMDADAGFRLPF